MKRLVLLALLLSSLILAGCTQSKVELSKDESFDKKKECILLEDKMRDQLNSWERYSNRDVDTTLYLDNVFYSPVRNSCIYQSSFIFGGMYHIELNDFFTKEVIYSYDCNSKDSNQFSQCHDMLEQRITELKWE